MLYLNTHINIGLGLSSMDIGKPKVPMAIFRISLYWKMNRTKVVGWDQKKGEHNTEVVHYEKLKWACGILVAQEQKLGVRGHHALLEYSPRLSNMFAGKASGKQKSWPFYNHLHCLVLYWDTFKSLYFRLCLATKPKAYSVRCTHFAPYLTSVHD